MKKQLTITIDLKEGDHELPGSMDALEELELSCFDRAVEMIKQGYREGELCESIDDIEYYGWWTSKYTTVSQEDKNGL